MTEDPVFKAFVLEGGQLLTGYITMDVNMAADKDRAVRIVIGRAVTANQPLPPR